MGQQLCRLTSAFASINIRTHSVSLFKTATNIKVDNSQARYPTLSDDVAIAIIKLIESDGWYLITTKGSHRQFKHPIKQGRVTIAGKPSDDIAPGTQNSILKQAQLKNME